MGEDTESTADVVEGEFGVESGQFADLTETELRETFECADYVAEDDIVTTVLLALRLGRPLPVERSVGDVTDALGRAEARRGGGTRIGHALATLRQDAPEAVDGLFAFAGPADVAELARQLARNDRTRLGYRYDPRQRTAESGESPTDTTATTRT